MGFNSVNIKVLSILYADTCVKLTPIARLSIAYTKYYYSTNDMGFQNVGFKYVLASKTHYTVCLLSYWLCLTTDGSFSFSTSQMTRMD